MSDAPRWPGSPPGWWSPGPAPLAGSSVARSALQAVLVGVKGVDGELRVTARHVLVLRLRKRVALVPLEEDSVRRIHVDVGRHRLSLQSLAISTHSKGVRLDLVLRRSDLGLVLLDLGAVDFVLLLVGTDLELLQNEVLRNLGSLCLEVGDLIGRDCSRSHDHRCGDRSHESQAQHPRPNRDEPPHAASGTWPRGRALLDTGHDWTSFLVAPTPATQPERRHDVATRRFENGPIFTGACLKSRRPWRRWSTRTAFRRTHTKCSTRNSPRCDKGRRTGRRATR